MKLTETDKILVLLVRKKQGNWAETEAIIGADLMSEFETSGYLSHVDDKWQVNSKGKARALRAVFSCDCF